MTATPVRDGAPDPPRPAPQRAAAGRPARPATRPRAGGPAAVTARSAAAPAHDRGSGRPARPAARPPCCCLALVLSLFVGRLRPGPGLRRRRPTPRRGRADVLRTARPLPAARGAITDRNGVALAHQRRAARDITADQTFVEGPDDDGRGQLAPSSVLGVDAQRDAHGPPDERQALRLRRAKR